MFPYVQGIDLVAAATALGGGVPIYKEVYADLKEKRVTMAVSMSLGILASLLSQEYVGKIVLYRASVCDPSSCRYFTASLITFVVLVAEKLEHMVTARGTSLFILRPIFISHNPRQTRCAIFDRSPSSHGRKEIR